MDANVFEEIRLRQFSQKVLCKLGVSEKDSEIVTDTLICADKRGINTHGIGKLDNYTERIEAKVLSPENNLVVERENAVTATINANNGFGQVAGYRAMEKSIEKAKAYGIGMVSVNNSNHYGIASYYALMAAEQKLIGISASNASPAIAPFGAKEKMFGTNPIAVAVPSKTGFSITLDMASTVVARGNIRQALSAGKEIPLGWARNKDGVPTTDPVAALEGTLEPIAGHKGSGLALMLELLCGVLSGSSLPGEVCVITDTSQPCRTGHLLLAISPGYFTSSEQFFDNIDETISRIKNLTEVSGEIFLPGEIEYYRAVKSNSEGIQLKASGVKSLEALSQKYCIPL